MLKGVLLFAFTLSAMASPVFTVDYSGTACVNAAIFPVKGTTVTAEISASYIGPAFVTVSNCTVSMVGLLQADGSGRGLLKIGTFGIAANGGTATESIVDIAGAACDATQCLPQIQTVPITLGVPFTFILSATAQFNSATDRGSGDVELALQAFSVPDGCVVSSCQIAEMIEVVAPEPNAGGIALAGLAATLLGSIVRHR